MSENSSPFPRGDKAETARTRRPPLPGSQLTTLIVLAIALAVLTVNIWMTFRWVEQQRAGSQEHAFWALCHPGFPAAQRERAFSQLVAAGNKEWRCADLQGLNLAGIALPGADLQGAMFRQSNLNGANLQRANFRDGSLEMADLTGANLSRADLSETQLWRAILHKANLRRANLRAASLEQVRGENTDLILADLSDANCLMANFADARLDGANLSGARLEAAVLKGARLALTRLDGADLKNADFTNANWWRALGLKTAQIESLKQQFAPDETADPAIKKDYAKWLGDAGRN